MWGLNAACTLALETGTPCSGLGTLEAPKHSDENAKELSPVTKARHAMSQSRLYLEADALRWCAKYLRLA